MTSQNIYLGPYVKCPVSIVTKTVRVSGCPKCKIQLYSKFCGGCGAKKGKFSTETTTRKIDIFNLLWNLNKISDVCCSNSFDFFIAKIKLKNINRDPFVRNDYKNGNEFYGAEVAIPEKTIADEIVAFKTTLEKELKVLKKQYGEISIEWGLLIWFS